MKVRVKIEDRERSVEITNRGGRVRYELDEKQIDADAAEVAPGMYSILLGGAAFEVRIEPRADGLRVYVDGSEYSIEILDLRQWRRDRGKVAEVEGRQEIVAPMPGKIVNVLVKTGEAVETGQGLMVVEAMKMQNEIKSPKSGRVERLLVREGQAVISGETLAVVA